MVKQFRAVHCVLLALITAQAGAQAPASRADALSPFGWLRELAGSCWRGEQPDGKPTDTQCYETQFGRFLRGAIEIHGDGEAKLRGDSVWTWDPVKRRIVLVTWATVGPLDTSEAYFEGELIRFPSATRQGSNVAETRRTWQLLSTDSFAVLLERKEGDQWREMRRVVYRKAPVSR